MKEIVTYDKRILKNVLKEKYMDIINKDGTVNKAKLKQMERENNDIITARITRFVK